MISFPALLRWFTSRSLAPPRYLPSRARCTPLGVRVTPFGCLRISGRLLLPAAFRGLPRPSSPAGSFRHPPQTFLRLTISPFPYASHTPSPSLPFLSKEHVFLKYKNPYRFMGQNRVELLTPALSERCSNQLSYCPNYMGAQICTTQGKKESDPKAPRSC